MRCPFLFHCCARIKVTLRRIAAASRPCMAKAIHLAHPDPTVHIVIVGDEATVAKGSQKRPPCKEGSHEPMKVAVARETGSRLMIYTCLHCKPRRLQVATQWSERIIHAAFSCGFMKLGLSANREPGHPPAQPEMPAASAAQGLWSGREWVMERSELCLASD